MSFFLVIEKVPVEVEPADVFEFLAAQRGDRTVVRLADRESGVSARTLARRSGRQPWKNAPIIGPAACRRYR